MPVVVTSIDAHCLFPPTTATEALDPESGKTGSLATDYSIFHALKAYTRDVDSDVVLVEDFTFTAT